MIFWEKYIKTNIAHVLTNKNHGLFLAKRTMRSAHLFDSLLSLIAISFIFTINLLISHNIYAIDYSITMTTSGDVNINTMGGIADISTSNLNVITNCKAGYNLQLGTSVNDNNLYLNGDPSNNSTASFITASDGITSLRQASNTWGYSLALPSSSELDNPVHTTLSPPTQDSIFSPVPALGITPATLKTPAETASETDIDDAFSVYYGAHPAQTLPSGTYRLDANNNESGTLVYYLTASPTCMDTTLDVNFNHNYDGTGSDTPADPTDPTSTIENFPTPSDNIIDLDNNTITLSDKTPKRFGYVFNSWNTQPDGNGTSFTPGQTVIIGAGTGELIGNVTLFAIWTTRTNLDVIYNYGDQTFNGTQYLNTDIALFSSANRNTDFDISFGIADRFYVSGQTNNMNVLMADMDESGSPYPGFVFRFQNNNATNYNFSKNNNTGAGTTNYAINTTNNFYLQRRGNILYAGTDPSSLSETLNYTNGPDFTTPLSFGAAINGSGSPFRYFGGELADITVTSKHTGSATTITLPNSAFTHYAVEGWYSDSELTQLVGTPGQTVTFGWDVTLYPKWVYSCSANTICYMGNGANEGLMTDQSVSSNSTARLIPSNFSRTGYGFAGWNTAEDGSGTNYGSSETINTGDLTTSGLKLYANWVQSAGTIQNWSGCAAMTRGAITALTDSRDGNTYAIAKYPDDHCWMMENLRLDLSDQDLTLTDRNTNHPDTNFATTINTTHPASSNSFCNTSSAECVNQILHNNNNSNRSLTQSYTANNTTSGWFAYGHYYNYYTATAGTGTYEMNTAGEQATGDLCPTGWRLPTGQATTGDLSVLDVALGGTGANQASSTSASLRWRTSPINYVYSGEWSNNNVTSRNSYGSYHTSTAASAENIYNLWIRDAGVNMSANTGKKYAGQTIRCLAYEAISYATTTVTIPEHVANITFTNGADTQTATSEDNVIDLVIGKQYTITANFDPGYELDAWTAGENATISDATANPATLNVTGDTTLTLTTQAIPIYEVTVTFDEHVSSIVLANATYGTQTITPASATDNGDGTFTATANMRKGITYTLSSSFTGDYTVDSWTTSANGTLGSATSKATTYVVTGTATLTLTSKLKTGATTLLPGQELNTKMKTLAEGTNTSYVTSSSKIKALRMADSLPAGFTPSTANTVSVANSEKPIYIFFDNTSNAGIMYFYTDAKDIYMNADSNRAFYYNAALTDISALADWNTGSVADMSGMFDGAAYSLTNIDALAGWNTGSVTDMSDMFYGASSLTNIDGASDWNTGSVSNMSYMFGGASALTNIDALADWNTGSVTNMSHMFGGASALTNIDALADWNTGSVSNMSYMFGGASALTNIDALADWNTGSVTNMSGMFSGATSLTNIDALAGWNTGSVTDMSDMFSGASSLTNIDGASNWNTGSVTNMSHMFEDASALTNIDGAADWNTGSVSNMSYMFESASALTNIDALADWNTGSVTNMSFMFRGASSLTNIDGAADWDTSKVTNMSHMFEDASALTNIDALADWNTGSVTNMSCMFRGASSLTNIDGAADWDTSKVTSMLEMFSKSNGSINGSAISNWDVRAVTATAGSSSNNYFACMFGYGAGNCLNASSQANYTQYADVPNFTSRSGTWDGHGTFIPGDTTVPSSNAVYVTVNFDEHVRSVGFYNATYGTQQVTTSGSNVRIAKRTQYTISSNYEDGYTTSSWSTTENGTLGTTTTPATTYRVTDTATLSLTSQQSTQSSCSSSPMLSTVVPGITYMQDINSSNKSTVLSAISTGATYQIKDSRDNETYCIGKLQDNNLWLLDNLALDLTNSTVLNGMSESNTNATNTTLNYLKNGGGTTSDQYAITGVINWTDSPTYASEYSYSDPLVNLTNKGTIPTDATSTSGGYKVGGYYNFCAASAGSYCYGNGTSAGTSSGNATEDICPKGWRMPTGNTSGEYSALANAIYGSTSSTSDPTAYANYRSALRLPLSGNFYSGTAGNQGSYGYFWSSTRGNNYNMYSLYVNTSDINPANPAIFYDRNNGRSVRCVADPTPTTQSATINPDSGATSVSYTDATYNTQNVTTNSDTPYKVTPTPSASSTTPDATPSTTTQYATDTSNTTNTNNNTSTDPEVSSLTTSDQSSSENELGDTYSEPLGAFDNNQDLITSNSDTPLSAGLIATAAVSTIASVALFAQYKRHKDN